MGAKFTIKQIHAAIASDRFVDPSQVPVEDSKKLVEGTALLQRHHGNTRRRPIPSAKISMLNISFSLSRQRDNAM